MAGLMCPEESCNVQSSSLRDFVLHLRASHGHLSNLSIRCPVLGCGSQFTTADSIRKHISYRHKAEYECSKLGPGRKRRACSSRNEMYDEVGDPNVDHEPMVDSFATRVEPKTASNAFTEMVDSMYLRSARFRLHVEHSFSIPTSTAHNIYCESMEYAVSLLTQVCEVVSLRLSELGVQDEQLKLYLECDEVQKACEQPKTGSVDTFRLLGYIPPISYDLLRLEGNLPQLSDQPKRGRPVMHYVPILESLKSYLSHEDVMAIVLRENLKPDQLSSYPSGSLYGQHPLFAQQPRALRISLYSDELEVCNPIGGNNKKHKISCVYFQVTNIGPKQLSSMQSIHLALMVKWNFVVKFGYDLVLKPLLDDLKVLSEEGINVQVKGGETLHFYGAVTNLCADNLTMHMLGGFMKCFSSGKVCRFCMADYCALSKLKHEGLCTLRTQQSQDQQVQLVARNKRLSFVYGVVGPSPLRSLPHFAVPDCLPPDVMHDVVEKLLPLNVKVVLRGLNKSKVLMYNRVLELMSSFQYGIVDRVNKAPALSKELMGTKTQVRGSASQKLHLFHFLSLVIGPYIPEGNKHWKLHLLLNQICDIVLAVNVTKDMVLDLSRLVTEHHNLWVTLVKGCYPPKLHYLLHYPSFFLLHGALRHVWCLRFEAFHLYIKRMSMKCNNFINPTATLSSRVQKKTCLQFSGHRALPPALKIVGQQTSVSDSLLPREVKCVMSDVIALPPNSCFVQVPSVTVDGLLLREGCYNILDVADGDPIFLKVSFIYIIGGDVYVVGVKFYPKEFNEQLHSFSISSSAELVCVAAEKLLPVQTLHAYHVGGEDYVKLKFTPVKTS